MHALRAEVLKTAKQALLGEEPGLARAFSILEGVYWATAAMTRGQGGAIYELHCWVSDLYIPSYLDNGPSDDEAQLVCDAVLDFLV